MIPVLFHSTQLLGSNTQRHLSATIVSLAHIKLQIVDHSSYLVPCLGQRKPGVCGNPKPLIRIFSRFCHNQFTGENKTGNAL